MSAGSSAVHTLHRDMRTPVHDKKKILFEWLIGSQYAPCICQVVIKIRHHTGKQR
jgi:hypothetical protein